MTLVAQHTAEPLGVAFTRLVARHRLTGIQAARLLALQRRLEHEAPVGRLRLNRNSRTMISLRGRPKSWTLSMHVGLLEQDGALAEIPAWVRGNGRFTSPQLRQCLQEVWQRQRALDVIDAGDLALGLSLPTLDGPLALEDEFSAVHSRWFSHLSKPGIAWSRSSGRRRLTHIRFGSYRRAPRAQVLINPRLNQPWVARCFVEHVLFHELCHHAQACMPVRGEPPHSARFRSLERTYPQHEQAQAWERSHLDRLLSDGS
jgi:hypothetical protein